MRVYNKFKFIYFEFYFLEIVFVVSLVFVCLDIFLCLCVRVYLCVYVICVCSCFFVNKSICFVFCFVILFFN